MLKFHAVDRDRWADLERLFEGRGGPKYCWCMVWRGDGKEIDRSDPASRKAGLERRVAAGEPVGLLGYDGDEPVAWCSVGPRETFRRLGGPDDGEKVWSIVCFFIRRDHRGQGAFHDLLAAAIAHARAHGADVIEAYPVDPDSPSYRFMGFVPSFAEAGFEEVGRAGTRRHVMRLTGKPKARRRKRA